MRESSETLVLARSHAFAVGSSRCDDRAAFSGALKRLSLWWMHFRPLSPTANRRCVESKLKLRALRTASRFRTVYKKPKDAFHEPNPLIPSFSSNGGEGARRAVEGDSAGFMVPMHGRKAEGALHEPPVWSSGFSRSAPPKGGTPYGWHAPDRFMVLMHA